MSRTTKKLDLHYTEETSTCERPPLRKRISPPRGFGAHTQGGGWWRVTWQPVAGATGYEYSHEFGTGTTRDLQSTIFAIPNGDRRSCRVRAQANGDASRWVTVTITVDAAGKLVRVDTDEGGDPSPPPPMVPVITAVTAGHESVAAWWDSDDADQWEVRLLDAHEQVVHEMVVGERAYVWNGLRLGTRYGVQVAALGPPPDGQRSDWTAIRWTKTLDDPTAPPSPPTGLRVHCKADRFAKAEWDPASDVDGWEVWLDDNQDDGDFTITPLVRLVELEPDTEYTVKVIAVRDDLRSDVAQLTFRTLTSILPPDPDDPDNEPDYDAPGGVIVQPTGESSIEVFWTGDGADHAAVSLDGRGWTRVDGTYHEWTDLQPGAAHIAHVYTVTGKQVSTIARKGATTRRRD